MPSLVEQRVPVQYLPGHYVPCRAPFPVPAWHLHGWCQPESEFTWIDGIEGVIELTIRRPRRAYNFTVEVVPNATGGRPQTFEVFFNYFRLGCFELPAPTTLSVELPSELFILRKSRIHLTCRHAVAGIQQENSDRRRLGVAVRGWCID